jgi:hypothetical protein
MTDTSNDRSELFSGTTLNLHFDRSIENADARHERLFCRASGWWLEKPIFEA